ncbi:MAG: DUF58 domain-containing protein [Pseudomonadota bacterium]
MRGVRTTASSPAGNSKRLIALEEKAHDVASRLPELLMEASRIASTVAHGIHGRRRAGPGETFWQFRQYESTDPTTLIDWRRTASSSHVFVREREWEAAHTLYLWLDLSRSMSFCSHLSQTPKRDRAIILLLATCEMLVRGGERVSLIGLTNPSANRKTMARFAETLAANAEAKLLIAGLPPKTVLPRFSTPILFSDFLNPPEKLAERLHTLSSAGVTGHVVQILDPAEETLPYEGRAEFISPSGQQRWVADRAESLRDVYQSRLKRHREQIIELTQKLGWSFMVHHTDRPASEPLLSLMARLSDTSGRAQSSAPVSSASGSSAYESSTQASTPAASEPANTAPSNVGSGGAL